MNCAARSEQRLGSRAHIQNITSQPFVVRQQTVLGFRGLHDPQRKCRVFSSCLPFLHRWAESSIALLQSRRLAEENVNNPSIISTSNLSHSLPFTPYPFAPTIIAIHGPHAPPALTAERCPTPPAAPSEYFGKCQAVEVVQEMWPVHEHQNINRLSHSI